MEILSDASEHEALRFVRAWVELLAEERFFEAENRLAAPWKTPKGPTLAESIHRYSPSYRAARTDQARAAARPMVSNPALLSQDGEIFDFWELVQPDALGQPVFGFEYFLPLDGKWSDLCVKFELRALDRVGFGVTLTNVFVP